MKILLTILLLSCFIQQDDDTREKLNSMDNTSLPFECTRDVNHLHRKASKSTMDSIDFYFYRDIGLTMKISMTRRDVYMLRKFEQPNFTLLALSVNFMEEGRTQWLLTYDKQNQIIDTLVCGIHFFDGSDRLHLQQWRIDEKREVQVSFVKIHVDPPLQHPFKIKPAQGQRVDTFYQLTDDGHFKKSREVKYKPQTYTSQYLRTENLWNGTENPVEREDE